MFSISPTFFLRPVAMIFKVLFNPEHSIILWCTGLDDKTARKGWNMDPPFLSKFLCCLKVAATLSWSTCWWMFGFVAGCHHLFPVPNLMARMLLHLSGISTYIYQVFAIIFCSTSDLQHSFDVSSLPQWVGLEELKLQKVAAEFRLGG